MTVRQHKELLGKEATVTLHGMRVEVIIQDIKMSYGHSCYLIKPVAGDGTTWVKQLTLAK